MRASVGRFLFWCLDWGLLWVLVSLLIFVAQTEATTLRVPQEYETIQEAVNAAGDGDTIRISPGDYPENISIESKSLVIIGSENPEEVRIVETEDNLPVLSVENADSIEISGVMFFSGRGENPLRGETYIALFNHTKSYIHNCLFDYKYSPLFGLRTLIANSTGSIIRNNRFRNGLCGIWLFRCDNTLVAENIFTREVPHDSLALAVPGVAVVVKKCNTLILNNSIDGYQTGIINYPDSNNVVEIVNNVIQNCSLVALLTSGDENNWEIRYNNFWNNRFNTDLYRFDDPVGSNGNISRDSRFVDSNILDIVRVDTERRDIVGYYGRWE